MKKNIGMESSHSLQAIFRRENDTSSADSAMVHGAYRMDAGSVHRKWNAGETDISKKNT